VSSPVPSSLTNVKDSKGCKASDNISTNQIICSWDDVPGAIGYNIYKVGTPDVYVAGGVQSPYVYNTTPNVTADFYVKAVNLNGDEGNASITDTGKTASISGSRVFKTTGQFTVPNGITELEICVTGGGGSGSIGKNDGYHSGGGYAGQFIREKMSVTEGDLLQVTIGFGGKPSDYTVVSDGVSGERDFFIIFHYNIHQFGHTAEFCIVAFQMCCIIFFRVVYSLVIFINNTIRIIINSVCH